MTADDDLDELYSLAPEHFTARRKELVAAAKKRGDREAATRIAAARRPTTAAWVMNALVHADATVRTRLAELSERLRAAHAAMDGTRIRESSDAQRSLIEQLVRAGFAAADVSNAPAALRDDVVGTLQAAIADPDVAARLGRLEKAERWSGFGDFGPVSDVAVRTATPRPKARPAPPAVPTPSRSEVAAARRRLTAAERDVHAAERADAKAAEELSARTAALAAARRRYEKLLDSLAAAERELNTADGEHQEAQRAATAAADRLAAAQTALQAAQDG
ncbi:hypothetical protein MMAD_22890 [Mycolicibacterium madagascariense]|uniref:Uncharacterized protein n=1 Tax=Mycolicibacterium madagascariense TaxID=212765 RepID=A0A7I7XFL3_9MYCO|nr:hypothetical protein [Mycolicibacterium madagascariense]MCV7013966.1 hypothetical protein [Mycolicibacterium madagascariense]BBZ27994.1 hypothetical protein MMAD_22890 [Mycolicibacterium madagascariense]